MPSQKGIFPKRSLSKNPKIDPIFPPPPNHTLWTPWSWAHLSCTGWVQVGGVSALVCAFHYLLYLSSYTLMPFCHSCHVSFCCVSLMFMPILHGMKGVGSWAWALGLVLLPLISLWAWTLAWQKSLPIQSVGLLLLLLLFLLCLWAHWLSFMSCWPIRLITYFLGFFRPIYFTFTSLLCLWVCWLSFLSYWPIGLIISFLGLPQPIYFTFTPCCAYRSACCHSWHIGTLG